MNRVDLTGWCILGAMAKHRTYTETEKIGTMLLALEQGVPHAAKVTNTPEPTLYQWFQSAGGLSEIRSFAELSVLHSKMGALKAVYDGVGKAVEEGVAGEKLLEVFAKLVEDGKALPAAAAQAGAQATLQVVIQAKEGEPEVIEVPRG